MTRGKGEEGRSFHAGRSDRLFTVPQVSAEFVCVEDEKKARSMADYWMRKEREKELSATSKITLEQLYEKIKEVSKI